MSAAEMESDLGKLFIGGISWETGEDRLKDYFGTYGEVVEAVIMRDRVTGRARGFGFVIFSDPAVAERVVLEKHIIDGRSVEAKKAVPRNDQTVSQRTANSIQGSPAPGSTKKIFVGGLASAVTESDFKKYFDQFGSITDVVVMYDHNTKRPRGFGFITYDSEEAVDRVLHKTFHELNGKMVEVKRAVPKELTPGPSRMSLSRHNYNLGRTNNFLNSYAAQGYNVNSIQGYGFGMDSRFSPLSTNRPGFPSFGTCDYGMSLNFEPSMSPSYRGNSYFSNNIGYGQVLIPYHSNKYNTPIGYPAVNARSDSLTSSTTQNLWSNGGGPNNPKNPSNAGSYLGSGNGGDFGFSLGNSVANWGTGISDQGRGTSRGHTKVIGSGVSRYGLGGEIYGRGSETGVTPFSSLTAPTDGYQGSYADLYSAVEYGDSTWRSASASSELDDPGLFSYGIGNSASDSMANSSEDYIGSHSVTNRQLNRGIAA